MLARAAPPSGFIEPCLPSPGGQPPTGPDWVHEIKHDGYRLMARRDPVSAGIRLLTRNGHDWTVRWPARVHVLSLSPIQDRPNHVGRSCQPLAVGAVVVQNEGSPAQPCGIRAGTENFTGSCNGSTPSERPDFTLQRFLARLRPASSPEQVVGILRVENAGLGFVTLAAARGDEA